MFEILFTIQILLSIATVGSKRDCFCDNFDSSNFMGQWTIDDLNENELACKTSFDKKRGKHCPIVSLLKQQTKKKTSYV
jgi:hypothetical protein